MDNIKADKIGIVVGHNYGTINIHPLSSNTHLGVEAKLKTEELIAFHNTIIGREKEFAKINNFLRENKSGHFIIKGKTGFGKSALLAQWINQRLHQNSLNDGQRISIAYHFFNREFSVTRNLEAGFTNLLKQICTYRKEEFPSENNGLRDKIIEIIQSKPLIVKDPLVIVMDALDEADEIIDPFFQHLPEGVFVIISARSGENENPPYLKNWLNLVNADSTNCLFLEEINKNKIKDWLNIEKLHTYHLNREDEIIDLIYQKTSGFPLYLKYLIEEIAEFLESGKTIEGIKDLLKKSPKGFESYIEKQFDELCATLPNVWLEKIEIILSSMSISLGAFSEQDVKNLTSLKATEIRGLPSKVWRWMRITPDEEGNSLFSFDHDLVRDIFATKILRDEKKDALERLLIYCAEWQAHRSRYALRHYPTHLYHQQRWQDLYQLAQNEEFLLAQENVFPLESDVGLRTLQTALQAAIETDDAPRMAEYVLKQGHKVLALMNESPLNALKISLEKAISQAALILKNNVEHGSLWFLLLAKRLDRNGQTQEANRILTRLQTNELPRFINAKLERVAVLLLNDLVNNNDEASFALQNKLLTEDGKKNLINELLLERNKVLIGKKIKFIERIITAIRDVDFCANTLSKIAEAQAQAGQFEQAKQTAQDINNTFDRLPALRKIAEAQAQAGQFEQAKQTVKKINNNSDYVITLSKIAEAQAQAGQLEQADKNFSQAKQTAQDISQESDRGYALRKIAEAQAQAGQFEQAKQTAQEISQEYDRAAALQFIAERQIQSEYSEAAMQTAQLILQDRNNIYPHIAAVCVAKGNKQLFKAFLPLTAYYLDSAYIMVGLMSKLYIEESVNIAEVLKKY